MKNHRAQIALAIVCVIIGFGITLQIKSVLRLKATERPDYTRVETLTSELLKEKEKSDGLYRQMTEYKNELDIMKSQIAAGNDASALLAQQLERAELLAGLRAVEGPGIVLKIDDSKIAAEHRNSPNLDQYLVHDSDLLMAVNELRASGAEALSINGERILATTEIRCVGPVVIVNGTRISSPFEIKAIGDPDKLDSGFRLAGGVYDLLVGYQFDITIQKSNKIKIDKYSGYQEFKNAAPSTSLAPEDDQKTYEFSIRPSLNDEEVATCC